MCRIGAGVNCSPRLTPWGSLSVSRAELDAQETARQGLRFWGGMSRAVGTGILTTTDIPTTTAHASLYNNDAERSLFIDQIGIMGGATSLTTRTLTLFASVTTLATKPNVMAAGWTCAPLNPLNLATKTVWSINDSVPAGTVWFPVLSVNLIEPGGVSDSAYAGATVKLNGELVIRPGSALNLFAVSSEAPSTTSKYPFVTWHERAVLNEVA